MPVKDGKVTSDARIIASLPTIKLCLEAGAKVMVTSHLGRPTEGEYAEEFSLQPVVNYLNDALDCDVKLAKDYLNGLELNAGELLFLKTFALTKARRKTKKNYLKHTQHYVTYS